MNIEEVNENELKEIKRAFTMFIMKVVKHSAIDFARKETLRNARNMPLSEEIIKKLSLSNYGNDNFFVEKKVNYMALEKIMSKEEHQKAISKLSKREKQIITLLYIEDKEITEVAKMLNLTNKTVLNTKNNAINKLKRDMEE